MALTKTAIVEQVSDQIGFRKLKSIFVVESLIEIIKSTLETGEDVLISNFGKFCVKDKKERMGRNPATGEGALLAARRVMTFKCSGNLRERINGG